MKKGKKTKASTRKTGLDRIVAQLRTMLRRETTDVILAGNLLIESRKHLEHGEWQPWLVENFDLSLRTAQNYVAAAEYVAQIGNVVADFSNLAPTVLYALAAGHYNTEEEEAILTATHKGRIDQTRASAVCDALAPPPTADDADDDDAADHDGGDAEAAEDPESTAILDGPPPDVPPPAPIAPPPHFALQAFDEAVTALKKIMTRPAVQFAATVHAGDLEGVESFIRAIRAVVDQAR